MHSLNISTIEWCDSPFWDKNLSWFGDLPQLTNCLEQTLFPSIPLLVALLILPYDILTLRRSNKSASLPSQWRIILNVMLIMFLSLISLVQISRTLWYYFANEIHLLLMSDLLSPIIKLLSYILLLILLKIFGKYGYRNPASQPFFWLTTVLLSFVNLWSISIDTERDLFNIIITSFEVFGVVLTLIISCLTPKRSSFSRLNDSNYDEECDNYCPFHEYNVFSRVLLFWVKNLLLTGYRTNIDKNKHLMPPCYYFLAKNSYKAFTFADKWYNSKRLPSQRRLLPLIWYTSRIHYCLSAVLEVFLLSSNFIQPYFLGKIIDFISSASSSEPLWHGLYYSIAYCFFVCLARAVDSHCYLAMTLACYRIRSSVRSAIYSKMIKLSPSARRSYTSGELNNLMGLDIDEICNFIQIMNSSVTVPVSLVIGIYLLWKILGPSSLTILGVMLILGPMTTIIMKFINTLQSEQMKLKDKRMEQISEIINNIKLLKLFGWEKPFMDHVTDTRHKELKKLRAFAYWSSVIDVLWVMAPMIVAGSCFTVYLLTTTNTFNAKTAFVSISIFNILRFPMAILPSVITRCIRAFVSYKRIRKFLNAEELVVNVSDIERLNKRLTIDDENVIYIKEATYTWSMDEEPILKNLNLTFPKGSLTAIVGKVGSGKSSIFSAILGEMYQTKGTTEVLGTLAYVPQTAWIQNVTFRQNITFVSDYDSDLYDKVINACALTADLDMLPAKHDTEIGERGINLSGGQKQRVSLARAVYQNCDTYLLDDPLSAVDAHVAQHLFQHVIGPNGMLSNKTRILATHNVSFLPNCDRIIVLQNGEIAACGSYQEVFDKGLLSHDLLSEDEDESEKESENNPILSEHNKNKRNRLKISESESILSSQSRLSRQISKQSNTIANVEKPLTAKEKLESDAKRAQLIDEEQQEIGNIKFSDYIEYIRRCGVYIIVIVVLAEFIYNCCEIGANYWLSVWTSQNQTIIEQNSKQKLYLSIYISAILFEGLFIVVGSVAIYTGSYRAAVQLHKDMLFSILRSPLSFFDVTPLGRIINRFNRDMGTVDEDIPFNFMVAIQLWIWTPLIYIMIWSTNVYMGIQILSVNIVFYAIYKLYLWTSRQLKRLESVTRSPIYSHFNESISGAASIRAYGVRQHFLNELQNRIDMNQNVARHQFSTMLWIELWTGIIGSIITFSTAIFIVVNRHEITPSLAGFVIIYSVEVINGISWVIRTTANLETSMVAVERVREYTTLTPEAKWESSDDNKPNRDWPSNGRIDFKNYTTCYRSGLDPVLKNLSLSINAGEKIGIVGRTGAGKSSMTLSLFRIIEPTGGKIVIDGIDITKIGLHDLRSKLTIIPQEPSLFAGTLRLNLDPFDQYSDEKLWTALENAHLKDFVSALPEALMHKIAEGGDNLSAGQRQLVCLARALLRHTKILILDEATAACDMNTDLLIQSTIKEKFSDSTILTIAHRLNTVIDYDRIIVLSNGKIAECGSPQQLLNDSTSLFYGLAKEAAIV